MTALDEKEIKEADELWQQAAQLKSSLDTLFNVYKSLRSVREFGSHAPRAADSNNTIEAASNMALAYSTFVESLVNELEIIRKHKSENVINKSPIKETHGAKASSEAITLEEILQSCTTPVARLGHIFDMRVDIMDCISTYQQFAEQLVANYELLPSSLTGTPYQDMILNLLLTADTAFMRKAGHVGIEEIGETAIKIQKEVNSALRLLYDNDLYGLIIRYSDLLARIGAKDQAQADKAVKKRYIADYKKVKPVNVPKVTVAMAENDDDDHSFISQKEVDLLLEAMDSTSPLRPEYSSTGQTASKTDSGKDLSDKLREMKSWLAQQASWSDDDALRKFSEFLLTKPFVKDPFADWNVYSLKGKSYGNREVEFIPETTRVVTVNDLVDYTSNISKLNKFFTECIFIDALPFEMMPLHFALQGINGTGKTSTVVACVNEMEKQAKYKGKIKVLLLSESDIPIIDSIVETVKDSPYRFILYFDNLSPGGYLGDLCKLMEGVVPLPANITFGISTVDFEKFPMDVRRRFAILLKYGQMKPEHQEKVVDFYRQRYELDESPEQLCRYVDEQLEDYRSDLAIKKDDPEVDGFKADGEKNEVACTPDFIKKTLYQLAVKKFVDAKVEKDQAG